MKCGLFLTHEVHLNCKLEIFEAILLLTVNLFGITVNPNEGQIVLSFELLVFMERQTISFPPALATIRALLLCNVNCI